MDWTFIHGLANGDKLLQLWAKMCLCVCVLCVYVLCVCCLCVCVVRMFRTCVLCICVHVCVIVDEWMKCMFHLNICTPASYIVLCTLLSLLLYHLEL